MPRAIAIDEFARMKNGWALYARTDGSCDECCESQEPRYVRVLSCCLPGADFWLPISATCQSNGQPVWTEGGAAVFFSQTDLVTGLVLCYYTDPADVRTFAEIQAADPEAFILVPDGPIQNCVGATSCSDNPPCDPCPSCCFYNYLDATECGGPSCVECGREYTFEFTGFAQANERTRFVGWLGASGNPRPEPCGPPDCINGGTSVYHHVSGLESTIVYANEVRFKVRCYCDEFGQKTCECVSYSQSKYFETASFQDRWDGFGCPPPKGDPPILLGRTIHDNFQTDVCPPSGIALDWCGFSEQDGLAILGWQLGVIGQTGCDDCTPCNGSGSFSFIEDEGDAPCPLGTLNIGQFSYSAFNNGESGSYLYTGNERSGRKFADSRIFDEYVAFNWTVTKAQECAAGQGCDGPRPSGARARLAGSMGRTFGALLDAAMEAA
jgi:hypothetical protein